MTVGKEETKYADAGAKKEYIIAENGTLKEKTKDTASKTEGKTAEESIGSATPWWAYVVFAVILGGVAYGIKQNSKGSSSSTSGSGGGGQ